MSFIFAYLFLPHSYMIFCLFIHDISLILIQIHFFICFVFSDTGFYDTKLVEIRYMYKIIMAMLSFSYTGDPSKPASGSSKRGVLLYINLSRGRDTLIREITHPGNISLQSCRSFTLPCCTQNAKKPSRFGYLDCNRVKKANILPR